MSWDRRSVYWIISCKRTTINAEAKLRQLCKAMQCDSKQMAWFADKGEFASSQQCRDIAPQTIG